MGKTEISSRKLEIPRDHFMKRWAHLNSCQELTVRTRHGKTDLIPNWERNTSRLYTVTLLI